VLTSRARLARARDRRPAEGDASVKSQSASLAVGRRAALCAMVAGVVTGFSARPASAEAAVRETADTGFSFTREVGDRGALDSNAVLTFEQTRRGRTQGDPLIVISDASMAHPYRAQAYFGDHGGFETGRWIVVSQKRYAPIGGNVENGAFIQGVSSLPDGSEPSMIAASTDVDGPAVAAEAWTRRTDGHRNASSFAAYDLDDVSGGRTPYSPGFGRKMFAIRADGGLWWGADLKRDLWEHSDVRLERMRPGSLRLTSPRAGMQANLTIDAAQGSQSLRFTRAGALQAEFVVNEAGDAYMTVGTGRPLRFYRDWSGLVIGDREVSKYSAPNVTIFSQAAATGVLDLRMTAPSSVPIVRVRDVGGDTLSGVDADGSMMDRAVASPGAPTSGRHATGACVLNLADERVYWCVEGGTPGRCRSAKLA
jgi:hypothetical protein